MTRFDPFWAATGAALPRSVGKTAVAFPYQLNLPADALIELKVRRHLGRFIPIWLNVGTLDTIAPCASHASRRGGPRAGLMRGGSESTPMCSSMWRKSALCVMKAMMRICPPHRGHNKGNTS